VGKSVNCERQRKAVLQTYGRRRLGRKKKKKDAIIASRGRVIQMS